MGRGGEGERGAAGEREGEMEGNLDARDYGEGEQQRERCEHPSAPLPYRLTAQSFAW